MEPSREYQGFREVDVKGRKIVLPEHIRDSYAIRTGNKHGKLDGYLRNFDIYPVITLFDESNPLFETGRFYLLEIGVFLPEEWIEELELKRRAIVLGSMNQFEIWNPQDFKKYLRNCDIGETYRERYLEFLA